jgi:hypothetical protein
MLPFCNSGNLILQPEVVGVGVTGVGVVGWAGVVLFTSP